MKVLLFWPFFYPESNAATARGTAFAKYLTKEGVKVSVITPMKKNFPDKILEYNRYTVYRYKTYDTIGESKSFLFSILYLPFSLLILMKAVKKLNPDLIIASTPGLFLAFESLIIAKYLKIPYIFDVRDTWELEKFTHAGVYKNKIKKYLEKLCCIHSYLIFAISPTLKKQIVKTHKLPTTKVKVVYNGADLESFSNIKKDEIYDLIFVGSPAIYRDLHRLFEAYSYIVDVLPNAKFLFVGWENTGYTQKICEYINALGISESIEFMHKIPHENIPNILAKAKIGVVSLVNEKIFKSAIGAKTYEYLSAGLPIACLGPSFDCELKKLVETNKIGIYKSNPKEFAEEVIFLLNTGEVRKNMSENALNTIKNFDMEKIIHEVYTKYLVSFTDNK